MKKTWAFLFTLLIAFTAYAAIDWEIPNNVMKMGDGSNASSKSFEMRMGLGASNPILSSLDGTEMNVNIPFRIEAGATVEGDLTIGDGIASNKSIIVDRGGSDPFLKWSEADSSWVFSNDGALEKKFGTGTGGGTGGINFLDNPSFEEGVGGGNGWNSSGVVPSQVQFTDFVEGNENFARMTFSGGGQYFESSLKNKPDSLGVGCSARFKYNGGDNNIDVVVIDGSANEIRRETLVARSEWGEIIPLQFECKPQMKIRFEATAAAAQFDLDEVYLGSTLGESNVASNELAAVAYFPVNNNCIWTNATSGMDAFPQDNDCNPPTYEIQNVGDWQTTPTGFPRVEVNNLPPGQYEVMFQFQHSSNSQFVSTAITDGTTTCSPVGANNDGNSAQISTTCVFNYTSTGNRAFEIYAAVASAGTTIQVANTVVNNGMRVIVRKYNAQSQKTFLAKTQNFFLRGKMDGVAIALAATSEPSLQGLISSSLVLQPEIGNAKISCAGASPEGTTCTGNEEVGIAFDAPSAGLYEVCFDFNHQSTNNGSTATNYFIERRTPDDSGQVEVASTTRYFNRQVNGHDFTDMQTLCHRFDIEGAKEVRFDMKYTKTAGTGNFQIQNSGANDDRRLQYRVKLIKNVAEAPILIGGQIYSPGASQKRTKKYTLIFGGAGTNGVCTAGPCTILKETDDWINGNVIIGAGGGGTFDFVTNPVFKPNEEVECYCQATAAGSNNVSCYFFSPNATGKSLFKADGSGVIDMGLGGAYLNTVNSAEASVDARVNFTCYGEE